MAFLSASRVQLHRYPRFGLAAVADTTPAAPKPIEVGRLRASALRPTTCAGRLRSRGWRVIKAARRCR